MKNIKEIRIDTIEKLKKELFFNQRYKEELGRHRDLCLYRGIPSSDYTLVTSLQRNCKSNNESLEYSILNNFAKYAELEDASVTKSVWHKMIIGQHHGLATRLMDWTKSPMVAMHFATDEWDMDQMDQRDCAIWELNVTALSNRLENAFEKVKNDNNTAIFSVDMLIDACGRNKSEKKQLKEYDDAMGNDKLVILEPPSIDPRIVNQYSFFAVVPKGVEKLEDLFENAPKCCTKYVISKNLKWEIRDMLDQANVNERIIYPGLDGIAKWVKRHYYVRDLNRLKIIKTDIAKADVDAVVNPTNPMLRDVGDTCVDIFKAAGSNEVEADCKAYLEKHSPKEKRLEYTDVVVTSGHKLKAKYIFHAIVPEHKDNVSEQLLEILYERALVTAEKKGCKSIAFPLLGAGNNGYDKEVSWRIALETCEKFHDEHKKSTLDIYFCTIDEDTYVEGTEILKSIQDKKKNKTANKEQ